MSCGDVPPASGWERRAGPPSEPSRSEGSPVSVSACTMEPKTLLEALPCAAAQVSPRPEERMLMRGKDAGQLSARSNPTLKDRPMLMALAFRMVGSTHDAEDVVQEIYARWYAMSPSARVGIKSPTAWLVRVAGRICLDHLGSARVRREKYTGEWLPEPLPDSAAWSSVRRSGHLDDPADRVALDDSVTMGMLVLLEALTPGAACELRPARRLQGPLCRDRRHRQPQRRELPRTGRGGAPRHRLRPQERGGRSVVPAAGPRVQKSLPDRRTRPSDRAAGPAGHRQGRRRRTRLSSTPARPAIWTGSWDSST